MRETARLSILLVALGSLAARAQPTDALVDLSSSEMRPLIMAFAADRGNLTRSYDILASPARRTRLQRFYTDWSDRLARLDFDGMSQDGKVDYILLRNNLDHELRRLELDAKAQTEIASYTPFAQVIVSLEEARRRMEPVQARQAAALLTDLAKQVETSRRALEQRLRGGGSAIPNRRVLGNRAANSVIALRKTLRAWFRFYDGYDPMFTWWAEKPYKTADAALRDDVAFLRERVAGLPPPVSESADTTRLAQGERRAGVTGIDARPGEGDDIVGNPIGREALLSELAYEMIPYTPEELVSIAEKEFVWCENEMKRASREMGYGDDWKKALEKVKTMHVEPGAQPELIRSLAVEAEKFLEDHDLITIPPLARESWRMQMMSPKRQLINPFFTGGEVLSVSYPADSMSYEQKMMSMRGNNIPFSRATLFHELIPGHHLQGFMAARFRPYRAAVGGTPFLVEGWSLYWELLLWDMKFQKTPEDRVGALFWRMHRCARIVFSLSFHLGKMTPQECIDLLVERVGHERENAVGEVRRSFSGEDGPLYQAAYLLGGMQLYTLRKELVGSGKMSDRQFHDAVLKENRIPVEMIRASLTRQKLTRDYAAGWRFQGTP